MKTYTLEEIREIVSRLAAQYGAKRVYLFGSFARGDMTESSDIDLRIDKGNIVVLFPDRGDRYISKGLYD